MGAVPPCFCLVISRQLSDTHHCSRLPSRSLQRGATLLYAYRRDKINSMVELSESELITRLKAGDERAVTRWFTDYKGSIERLIWAKVSFKADVDELVQEVFLTCLRELIHFRGTSSLKTWMLTIARHKVADFYRAKYAKKVIHLVSLLDSLAVPSLQLPDEIQAVQSALARLTPELCELLLAKYIDGKSVKQLALELVKTTKAIESMLFRARNDFKVAYISVMAESRT